MKIVKAIKKKVLFIYKYYNSVIDHGQSLPLHGTLFFHNEGVGQSNPVNISYIYVL